MSGEGDPGPFGTVQLEGPLVVRLRVEMPLVLPAVRHERLHLQEGLESPIDVDDASPHFDRAETLRLGCPGGFGRGGRGRRLGSRSRDARGGRFRGRKLRWIRNARRGGRAVLGFLLPEVWAQQDRADDEREEEEDKGREEPRTLHDSPRRRGTALNGRL